MRLKGIDFPPVMNASGAQNFFGEGFPFHKIWKYRGLTFENCGFVAKTTTLSARAGNMPLKADGATPKSWLPKCIVVNFKKKVVLNAVGLSGRGAHFLLNRQKWQNRRGQPFFISFMATEGSSSDHLAETEEFVALLEKNRPKEWNSQVGLEINYSCPNVGLDSTSWNDKVSNDLNAAGRLGIPTTAKFNALTSPQVACEIAKHPHCDAITMGNTIPWLKFKDRIPWKDLFGSEISPLHKIDKNGGGLSGWPLLPIICDWIREARGRSLIKPIIACGGIDSREAVEAVEIAGANALQLGSIAILSPGNMKSTISRGNELFS